MHQLEHSLDDIHKIFDQKKEIMKYTDIDMNVKILNRKNFYAIA